MNPQTPAQRAAEEMRSRRKRVTIFGADLFRDPAWGILLDLFIAEETGKTTSISSACIASGIAASTGLRYVVALEEEGHIVRIPHPRNRRQWLLKLTDSGRAKMLAYFAASGPVVMPIAEPSAETATGRAKLN